MFRLTIFLVCIHQIKPTPIKFGGGGFFDEYEEDPPDFCQLPPKLGYEGARKFLEECDSLGRFPTLPLPMQDDVNSFGVHPVVCCPKPLAESAICFESDPWCETYKQPDFSSFDETGDYVGADGVVGDDVGVGGDYYDYQSYDGYDDYQLPSATMAEEDCSKYDTYQNSLPENANLSVVSQCVAFTECPTALDSSDAPEKNLACGFDTKVNQIKICCPQNNITEAQSLDQPPRFPKSGRPRPVDDKSDLCSRWKRYGGCNLDQHFNIDEDEGADGFVESRQMFDWMQKVCPKTCGWVESGCHDLHPRCKEWARGGMCYTSHFFMSHTCRETCGVCGFLAPENKEIQKKNGKSYTDFTNNDFECGRTREGEEDNSLKNIINLREAQGSRRKRSEGGLEEDLEVFSFSLDGSDINCGSTIINDRWMISASHCHDDFSDVEPTNRIAKVNTIRDNTEFKELIEVKRVYKHPNYEYPRLYDDIAVVELGRRIEYDYDQYGDSPSCVDQSDPQKDIYLGLKAFITGYGKTETGSFGDLIRSDVTVISDSDCTEMLKNNASRRSIRKKGTEHIPIGLSDGLFCAQGDPNEDGVFPGSCPGDSGGPLQIDDPNNEQRRTLIGIVSGGIGCGKGVPGWYTKLSLYMKWVRCIIDTSVQFRNNQKKVEEACRSSLSPQPSCVNPNDLPFGLEEFTQWNNKHNNKYRICEDSEPNNDDNGADIEVDSALFNLRQDEDPDQ